MSPKRVVRYVGTICLTVTSVSAQGSRSQQAAPQPSDEIQATGCVSKNAQGTFTLSNAAVNTVPWIASGVAQSPKPNDTEGSPSKTSFTLSGGSGLDTHVGHIIQVTGKVLPLSANIPPSPDAAAASRDGVMARSYTPQLQVRSFRMIGTNCQTSR